MLRLALLTALLCAGAAWAAPRGRLGLLVEDPATPAQSAIRDWAQSGYAVTCIHPDGQGAFLDPDGQPVPLGDFSCLWYHCTMAYLRELSPWTCKLTTEASLRAMADYLACGGGLYLTGSAARYLNRLGVEPYFASLNYVKEGTGGDCGYEAMQPDHPIFAGLGKTFMVQNMRREEGGACGFWTPERLQYPLAYSYLCTPEQQQRCLAGTPLARWAGLKEDRFIIVEHQAGEGEVITNGPYFYYFDDPADPHRANLERLTRNILGYLWHEGPVIVGRGTAAAKTVMRRSGAYWGMDVPEGVCDSLDLMDYHFDLSLLAERVGYGTKPWPPSVHLERTIGLAGERGQGYIAGDIRHHPVVSMYAYPQCKSLFPVDSDSNVLTAWCLNAALSHDPKVLQGLRNCVEFVLWAQYDENGYNPFLDATGQMKFEGMRGNPDWAYGWPYMNFEWPDGFGYTWKTFESYHHTTPAFPLVKAYEITGDERCLQAARNWLLRQLPRYGPHDGVYEVEWQGKKAYWTGYCPMPPAGKPLTAVDNVQTLLAEPLAAVGYHTKDPRMLERARGMLWYVCRELAVDGEWYYDSIDSVLYGRQARSHMAAVVGPGLNAIAYLEAAGVDCSDIKRTFARGVLLYKSEAAPSLWGFTCCLAKLLPEQPLPRDASANGRRVEFLDLVKIHHAELKEVTLKDTMPEGFRVPETLRLTIEGRGATRRLTVSPQEFAGGVPISEDCRPGDAFTVGYALQVEDITRVKGVPAPQVVLRGIEAMRGPDAWVEKTADAQYVADPFHPQPINVNNCRDWRLYGGPPAHVPMVPTL